MNEQLATSVEDLIISVRNYIKLHPGFQPWFRGEPKFNIEYDKNKRIFIPITPLIPKLYRKKRKEDTELTLLQHFRIKAPLYLNLPIPQRDNTDQWLFLAQHVGLPTRLLDWSESLLVALYFAIIEGMKEKGAVVWMLNHIELNRLTTGSDRKIPDYSLTWFAPEHDHTKWLKILLNPDARIRAIRKNKKIDFSTRFFSKLRSTDDIKYNAANINIRAAWENNPQLATDLPFAILPTYIHPQISLQMSRFTIWGKDSKSLAEMIDDPKILIKYVIDDNSIEMIRDTLRFLGISKLSLFPELDSLAQDLEETYY